MPATLHIQAAGPGTTIQDGGRHGLLRFGVTPAGPMDRVAFEIANLALGNAPGDAAIELATGGLALTTDAPIMLVFAGGGFAWRRGDQALPSAARILLRPGEALRARAGGWGAFAYLAVPGGIDVPKVMGSRATHTRSRLGGLEGRGLRAGDRLATVADGPRRDDAEITTALLRRANAPLRVVLGPQDDHFNPDAIAAFLGGTFKLTGQADRMAYRLEGPKIAHARDFNIVSDGIAFGAIQVAGDSQPMVLMADRQPTGGYPKIAHVCQADVGRLAQLRPGETCTFERIEIAEARRALLALEDRIAAAADENVPLRLAPTDASLMRENLIDGVCDGDVLANQSERVRRKP